MKRLLLGIAFGALGGIYGLGRGDGFGDVNYRYVAFWWRGRRIQIELSDEVKV